MKKHALMAFVIAGLISSISVTECINEAEAQTSVTQTVEAPVEEAEPVKGEEPVKEEKPVKEEPAEETFWMDLGSFEITAYCSGTCCSSGTGITASGNTAEEGKTIGVDPDIIPLGSKVKIVFADGTEHVYRADDTGSAINGNIIDLYMGTAESGGHERALQFGRQTCQVFIEEVNEPRN